jgi:hypothetical protein
MYEHAIGVIQANQQLPQFRNNALAAQKWLHPILPPLSSGISSVHHVRHSLDENLTLAEVLSIANGTFTLANIPVAPVAAINVAVTQAFTSANALTYSKDNSGHAIAATVAAGDGQALYAALILAYEGFATHRATQTITGFYSAKQQPGTTGRELIHWTQLQKAVLIRNHHPIPDEAHNTIVAKGLTVSVPIRAVLAAQVEQPHTRFVAQVKKSWTTWMKYPLPCQTSAHSQRLWGIKKTI